MKSTHLITETRFSTLVHRYILQLVKLSTYQNTYSVIACGTINRMTVIYIIITQFEKGIRDLQRFRKDSS